ncbi:MAG: aminotransferase class I/II-fold pyridoxal phosphate-dependent enzyme [Oscillospiraceae bacterium]|jgi:aspartate/methionine/tyrosine aminotransferase|nr:aminotransferase class I/II-fold pyridoxal phosphate-dependent enzyme [Oscillospiraceae bacterium]
MRGGLNNERLLGLKEKSEKEYAGVKAKGLKLDMSRGKPGPDVLELSNGMLKLPAGDYISENGTDCRNYGIIDGIPEAKRLFAQMLGVSESEVIVGGNSSLQMMYDAVARAMLFGAADGFDPWSKSKIKFLCPVPGYDRHFSVCETMGIEMLSVPTDGNGPDMDAVERLVSEDESVKGIWCVPMYSNPTGIVYSDAVVKRLANMKPKAPDFRIFWDNAYCVHHLTDEPESLADILGECKKAGNPDMVYIFASTSKISFPGGGVGVLAASAGNVAYIKKHMGFQTIGSDKLNQLRHVQFFRDLDGIKAHMGLIKNVLKPKFDLTLDILEKELSPDGLGSWHKPKGGYFISFDGAQGTAKRTVALCKEAGVVLTGAGAAFPYGKDPEDKNIRIAPTYPSLEELRAAMEVFCVSVKLANAEKIYNLFTTFPAKVI